MLMKGNRVAAYLCLTAVAIEMVFITIAWITSAIDPFGPVSNPFSSESLRWMFRHSLSLVTSKWLIGLLLVAMTYGSITCSGMGATLRLLLISKDKYSTLQFRERMAMRSLYFMTLLFVTLLSVIPFLPGSLLLNSTGNLFPSPFSEALFPLTCLWMISSSVVFGFIRGTYNNLVQVIDSLSRGISRFAPIIVLAIVSLHCIYVIKMLIK